MKKLITILILILYATLVMAQDKYLEVEWTKEASKESIAQGGDDYYGLIVKQANEDWKGNHEMFDFVINRQCEAFYKFVNMEKAPGMPKNAFEDMKVIAIGKWTERDSVGKLIGADWIRVLQVYKNQMEAYSKTF